DFRRHRVCRASCEFLDSIADSAVLNVEESNPALYMYIPELEEALRLRQQLNSLRGYLATCRQEDSLQLLTKRLKSPHLYEEIHSYSIQELSEVHSGGLLERMRKTVRTVSTHVRQCPTNFLHNLSFL
ncbi:Pleckstrin homology domain-containing family M member 3, partial [Geodia barretti]